jgi:hypothetical protein
MHGKGAFTWRDGRKYRGLYKRDKKDGFGVFEWPDGRKYIGMWQRGLQHGRGVFVSAKGSRHEGEWETGKLKHWIRLVDDDTSTDDSPPLGSYLVD